LECLGCNREINGDAAFCRFCGEKVVSKLSDASRHASREGAVDAYFAKKDAENSLVLRIPGILSTTTAVFKETFVDYSGKRIFYQDIVSVTYHSIKRSVNFIPMEQSYHFAIRSEREEISLSFSSAFYIRNKEKQDTWARLIALSDQLIEPLLVEKLVGLIFREGRTVAVGGVLLDKIGYCRSKFFGGKACVAWGEKIYVPQYVTGDVVLFKDENGKARQFTRVPMSTQNAVVLPKLIRACANYTPLSGRAG